MSENFNKDPLENKDLLDKEDSFGNEDSFDNKDPFDLEIEDSVQLSEDLDSQTEKLFVVVQSLLQKKDYAKLKDLFEQVQPVDIAELLEEFEAADMTFVFRLLPKDIAADTFIELPQELQRHLIRNFSDKELAEVTAEFCIDDFADVIEDMPSNVVKRVLGVSEPERRDLVNIILGYPKESAGSVMTTEYINLHHTLTVGESLDKIREQAIDKETIYTCYITDELNKLIGLVTMKDLFTHPLSVKIGDIMETNVISVDTDTDREKVVTLLHRYGFLAMPVTDKENHMVGIVTIDDAVDVLMKETAEDISKMAAITPTEKPYFETSVFSNFKSRIPWLLLLMVSATFTSIILTKYENILASLSVLLIASVPMLMDTAGNAGSQTSTTVIQSMVRNHIEMKDVFKVIWKELKIGISSGLALAAACFVKLVLIDGLLMGSIDVSTTKGFLTALTVCITMFATVVLAKLSGAFLPLLAKKLKLDPAVIATPLITTIVDTLALIIFCWIAIAMLQGL